MALEGVVLETHLEVERLLAVCRGRRLLLHARKGEHHRAAVGNLEHVGASREGPGPNLGALCTRSCRRQRCSASAPAAPWREVLKWQCSGRIVIGAAKDKARLWHTLVSTRTARRLGGTLLHPCGSAA